jgi:hypothetical protein
MPVFTYYGDFLHTTRLLAFTGNLDSGYGLDNHARLQQGSEEESIEDRRLSCQRHLLARLP